MRSTKFWDKKIHHSEKINPYLLLEDEVLRIS